jgi:hypothetical protein
MRPPADCMRTKTLTHDTEQMRHGSDEASCRLHARKTMTRNKARRRRNTNFASYINGWGQAFICGNDTESVMNHESRTNNNLAQHMPRHAKDFSTQEYAYALLFFATELHRVSRKEVSA